MPPATPRPATSNDKVASVKNVTDGLRGILGATNDLFNDRPGFIQGGGGGWPLADAVRAVSQFNCRQWARADKSAFSARVNAGNSALCNPYLSDIGMLPDEGDMAPGFPGGQCAVQYVVSAIEVLSNGTRVPTGQQTFLLGPISSITRVQTGTFQARFDVVGAVATGSVTINYGVGGNASYDGPTRTDGNPDNCGSSAPFYTPPGSTTGGPSPDTNISIDIPGIGPITVTVTPNAEGNPVVCYEEVDVCIEIPISGGDGTEAPPAPPPGSGEPATPIDTGVGSDAEDEAPPDKMLWALKINILEFPPEPNEYAPGVFRGVCYVYIGDSAGLDHDPAGAMLRDGQLIFAERDYLTKWRVASNSGYNLRVTPYYKKREA